MSQNKPLKIVINNTNNFPEVVDSVADVLEIGVIVESALGDGFQYRDLFQFLAVEPIITEVIEDVPVFLEQFKAMPPQVAAEAVFAARERLVSQGKKIGKVTGAISKGLLALTSNYGFVIESFIRGKAQYELWKKVLENAPIFPDELPG